ncbi:MAG: alpha/beta hydrolase [Myxococcaceae bacterium]|nr:alpha/beta hydrolase [Myxococcaceae bacterium]
MVMKGQFLERPTLVPLPSGLVLEGVSHRGDRRPGVLVLPPPPAEGSGMDHVVGAEIAFAVSRAGHPCLRFNYRGVGGSQGRPSTRADELLEDARCAWEVARDNTDGDAPVVVAVGGSDAVALSLTAQAPCAGLVFIHPGVSPSRADVSVPLAVVLPELEGPEIRSGWSARLEEGALTVVRGADRSYHRNLPQVGKAVVALLHRVAGSTGNP